MFNFADHLNPEQLKAVSINQGPILILAGAGSGKTRVITYRIAHLISVLGISPSSILAMTFTNKAANEMKTRIFNLLPPGKKEAPRLWIRTYHSTCAKILREKSHRIGIPSNFVIYDDNDQIAVVKECLKALDINAKELKPDFVLAMISRAKENLLGPEEFNPRLPPELVTVLKNLYRLYQEKLNEYNALDFDDLIFKTVALLKGDQRTLDLYQSRFKYILVDEYQDTNRAQYVFTNLLAGRHRNLCVVGDDDQSIYSWRGAEINNILDFEDDYPDAVVIKLEQNYRSTKNILRAASEVVANNRRRKGKVLWCENDTGEKIDFFEAEDDSGEADFVCRRILEMKIAGRDLAQVAVFYRLNYQSRIFEEHLVKYRVPYEVVGALKFYERAEIKNILAYLRVINNQNDAVSLKRIINLPLRNIGRETVEKIAGHQAQRRISFYQALADAEKIPQISPKTKKSIADFTGMISSFVTYAKKSNLYELALRVARESGYLEALSRRQTEDEYNRLMNVEQLLISIKDFQKTNPASTLEDYLESITLRSDIDDWRNESNRVSLMTFHNAKGLEFETVFLTGLEDGIIPHYKCIEEGRVEEERRLMYVGITRAKHKIYMTAAAQRESFRGGFVYTRVSPFVDEVPADLFAAVYERSRC